MAAENYWPGSRKLLAWQQKVAFDVTENDVEFLYDPSLERGRVVPHHHQQVAPLIFI